MLFTQATLEAIANGAVDVAFRRWRAPRVRAGSRLTTAIGVLEVIEIDELDAETISSRDAARAGFTSREHLLAVLNDATAGRVYRIRLRLAGPIPGSRCGSAGA